MPDAIPYVTSYYNKDWGFCLSEKEKEDLPDGKYRAFIDSKFKKGHLEVAEAVLPGKSKKEILVAISAILQWQIMSYLDLYY